MLGSRLDQAQVSGAGFSHHRVPEELARVLEGTCDPDPAGGPEGRGQEGPGEACEGLQEVSRRWAWA